MSSVAQMIETIETELEAPTEVKEETLVETGVNPEPFLLRKSGQLFYNASPLDM